MGSLVTIRYLNNIDEMSRKKLFGRTRVSEEIYTFFKQFKKINSQPKLLNCLKTKFFLRSSTDAYNE